MGAGYSVPDDEVARSVIETHKGYDLYPCFFVLRGGAQVARLGSLADLEAYLSRFRDQGGDQERFIVLCLGDGKCTPCDIAKERILQLQGQGRVPHVRFLERGGSAFAWRTALLTQRQGDAVKRWAVI